jgi:hypothetical protein
MARWVLPVPVPPISTALRCWAMKPPTARLSMARVERAGRQARRRYERTIRLPNAAAESLMVDVCIRDEEPGRGRHADLEALLAIMAGHLGISGDG